MAQISYLGLSSYQLHLIFVVLLKALVYPPVKAPVPWASARPGVRFMASLSLTPNLTGRLPGLHLGFVSQLGPTGNFVLTEPYNFTRFSGA